MLAIVQGKRLPSIINAISRNGNKNKYASITSGFVLGFLGETVKVP
jgi:hypothetical protein